MQDRITSTELGMKLYTLTSWEPPFFAMQDNQVIEARYDLAYLWDKLPPMLYDGDDRFYKSLGVVPGGELTVADYANGSIDRVYLSPELICRDEVAANAVCLLLITLIRKGYMRV